MKIAWVAHADSDSVGGAELTLLESAKGLRQRGVGVHAILPWRQVLAERLEQAGVPVSVLPYRFWINTTGRFDQRARSVFSDRPAWKALSRLLGRIEPDVVVTNTLVSPAGAFASKWAGLPHIWYVHELFGAEGHNIFFDLGERLSLFLVNRLSRRIIVTSQTVQGQLQERLPADKIRKIYGAVEVPLRPRKIERRPGSFKIIKVSRIARGKRQEDAVRALGLLVGKGLDIHLTLVGYEEREYGDQLRRVAVELGVGERIEFIPFTEDSFSHVAASDAALMCSIGEAFGRVTVEAMKLGKPVVGANSAGTAELICDRVNGLLYEPANVTDLAAKIETLYHDRALLNTLGEHAQAWATRTFNLEVHTSDLLRVFAEAASAQEKEVDVSL